MLRWVVLLAGLVVIGSGCGGHSQQAKTPPRPKRSATPASALPKRRPAAAGDVAVIKHWADALRRGRVAEAAALFAIPSIVSNDSPPLRLTTRAQVRLFHRTLPCGAKLKKAIDTGAYVVATFVLTERPGAGKCAGGVGNRAYTAFLIRRHKIAEWRRVEKPAPQLTPAGPES